MRRGVYEDIKVFDSRHRSKTPRIMVVVILRQLIMMVVDDKLV
jgi:hypothetical protein